MKSSMPSAVHVTRGASYLVIQSIATNAVTVISFAVLARLISPKEMGIWSVLWLTSGICQTVGTLAIPSAAVKFVAENISRNQREMAAAVFYQSVKLTLTSAILVGVGVFLAAPELAKILLADSSYAQLFQILAIDIVLNVGILQVLGSVLLGLQKFKESAAMSILMGSVLRQILIIGLILWLRNFVGLVIGWALSDLATIVPYFFYVYRSLGGPRFEFPIRKLMNFSWPLLSSGVAGFAQSWFDRALLIAYVPLAILGIYNTAIVAYGALAAIIGAMGSALFPAYTAVQTVDKNEGLSNAAKLASRYTSFVGVPLALGLFASARPALTLFVGKSYVEATLPLMILCGFYALTVFGTIALPPLLLALGETLLVSAIDVVTLVISLAAAVILLPISGMIGAAIAHGLAVALAAVFTVVVLRRKMILRVDVEAVWKSLAASAAMVVVVMVAQSLIYRITLLPVYVVLGAFTYLILLRLLRAIRPSDIELIRGYSGQKLDFVADAIGKVLLPREKAMPTPR